MKNLFFSRKLFLAVVVVVLAGAVPAGADVFTGGSLSVDVPRGWTADYDAGRHRVTVRSPENDYWMAVECGDAGGLDAAKKAEALSKEVKGSRPESLEENPFRYQFQARIDGREVDFTVAAQGGKYLVYQEALAADSFDKYSEEMERIWDSLKSSDPAENLLLNPADDI